MSKATENISNFPATGYRDSFANNIFLASEQVQFSGFAHCHLDQAAYNSWIVTLHLKANPKYSPRYTTWRSDYLIGTIDIALSHGCVCVLLPVSCCVIFPQHPDL